MAIQMIYWCGYGFMWCIIAHFMLRFNSTPLSYCVVFFMLFLLGDRSQKPISEVVWLDGSAAWWHLQSFTVSLHCDPPHTNYSLLANDEYTTWLFFRMCLYSYHHCDACVNCNVVESSLLILPINKLYIPLFTPRIFLREEHKVKKGKDLDTSRWTVGSIRACVSSHEPHIGNDTIWPKRSSLCFFAQDLPDPLYVPMSRRFPSKRTAVTAVFLHVNMQTTSLKEGPWTLNR